MQCVTHNEHNIHHSLHSTIMVKNPKEKIQIVTYMSMRQHFLHYEIIINFPRQFASLIMALSFFIIFNLLIELQVRNWLFRHILTKVFKEQIAQNLIEYLVETYFIFLLQVFVHHTSNTARGKKEKERNGNNFVNKMSSMIQYWILHYMSSSFKINDLYKLTFSLSI